jgi:hypothetical protein
MNHTLPAAILLLLTVNACADQPAESVSPANSSGTQPATSQPDTQPIAMSQPDSPQTQPDDGSAESWLERIESAANEITTLTAKLRYDRNQLLLGDEQRRFGTLVYQAGPPPKFQVHFNKKMVDGHWSQPDLYYIYDGRWLLKRDHENKTAVRYQLVADDEEPGGTGGTGGTGGANGAMELGEGPFPIPLNLKKDRVLARFDVAVVPVKEGDPENSIHLNLIPKEGRDTDLTAIDLWFDRDSLLPVLVSTLDDSETQTVVRLTETESNPELPEQSFDTVLPTEPGWQTDENRINGEDD